MSKLSQTNTRILYVACALTALIAVFVVATMNFKRSDEQAHSDKPEYQQTRLIRFSYEVANTSSKAIHQAAFSSYLPVATTSSQVKGVTKSSLEFNEQQGKLGNRVAKFDLGVIPPYGKKVIKFVAEVSTAESPNRTELSGISDYLAEETFVEINHPTITALAKQLKGDSPLASMQNIFNWVSTQIQYAGYVSQDQGALHAIETKAGDCTEYMYTVMALARALDIPARGIGGYVYEGDTVASATDYHNWAEVYLEGRWHIVDAQEKVFMTEGQNYIAMRVLSDQSVSLLGSSHRFSTVNEKLKVTMQ